MAGATKHIFRHPRDIYKLLADLSWSKLLEVYGKRDDYQRRIGRYNGEVSAKWLGVVGRNMAFRKKIFDNNHFYELPSMGFEDVELAYRLENKGYLIFLPNDINSFCLHMFHTNSPDKMSQFNKSFEILCKNGLLNRSLESIFWGK